MWVFQVNGNTVIPSDRYWGNTNLSATDVSLGGTNNIQMLGYLVETGKTTVKFRRPLVTGDKYDKNIAPGIQNIYWAYGTSSAISQLGLKRGRVQTTLTAN